MPERSETKSPAEVCKRTYGTGQKVKKKKKNCIYLTPENIHRGKGTE